MLNRASRLAFAAILLTAGVTGGYFAVAAHQKVDAALSLRDDLSVRFRRMMTTAGDIASAQQAYVAPGQPDEPWLERTATLLQDFSRDLAAIRPRLRSADATAKAKELQQRLDILIALDGKARQHLQEDQKLLAADLIFSEGRDAASALEAAIRTVDEAEHRAADAQRAAFDRQQWMALGAVAALWVLGLAVLLPMSPATQARSDSGPTAEGPIAPATSGDKDRVSPRSAASIDLAAAAEVCSSLARVNDAQALRHALARAATVLDASGVIVWMGAGEELFAALAHGYDERLVSRLGPISRTADNATAAAWRTGQMRTVAGDASSSGAIVTPLFGVDECFGVLATEVRHGREDDPVARAVATMIAAQLATALSAWPSASSPPRDNATDAGTFAASAGR